MALSDQRKHFLYFSLFIIPFHWINRLILIIVAAAQQQMNGN
jgi:hypothetical protein